MFVVFIALIVEGTIYSYFMPVWGIVKIAAPRCHGQLDALLPEAKRQWCIELSMVQRGSSFAYSAKQPWNNGFITQAMLKIPVFSPRHASLIGMRHRYTQLTVWHLTSFSRGLMSSTRQQTKLLPAVFPLLLSGWRHERGIVNSMDQLTSYERR